VRMNYRLPAIARERSEGLKSVEREWTCDAMDFHAVANLVCWLRTMLGGYHVDRVSATRLLL